MTPTTITIPAFVTTSGVKICSYVGKYFLITALNGPFRVETNNGEQYSFSETGSGFGNDQSRTFSRLNFYNDTGVPVTVTFYASKSPIKTPDVNVTSSVNVTTTTSSPLASSSEIIPGQFFKIATVIAGAVALAAAGTFATTIVVIARKTLAPVDFGGTANVGNVAIGFSNANNTSPIELAPNDAWTFSVSAGRKLDLGKIFLDVLTDNDGVVVLYY